MASIIPGVLTDDDDDYVARLKKAQHAAGLVQIDIVDGQFAPSTTIGVETIKRYPPICLLEVQLMVVRPADHISLIDDVDFVTRILFPYETKNVRQNIYRVKKAGKQVGLSINPETGLDQIERYADDVDLLCIFSASPGFSGKKLETEVYGRIRESKKLYPNLAVEVDIGVNMETAAKLSQAGADFLVATSALANAQDYLTAYEQLAKAASSRG